MPLPWHAHLAHPWMVGLICYPFPASCLQEQGVQDSMSAPPPPPPTPTGPGRNPECRSHTGGASSGPADHFLLAELVLGSPCWALPLPGPQGSRQGDIFSRGPPLVGPLEHAGPGTYLLGSGLCLPPAIAVETSLGEKGGREPAAGRVKPWDPHA